MRTPMLLGWLCAAGAGLVIAGVAAAPASAQTFAGTADVVEVEVPVQVVRDGQPVRGLTRDDFEVYDGRTKQTITGFHAVDLSAPPAPSARVPSPWRDAGSSSSSSTSPSPIPSRSSRRETRPGSW
jgi:hypothetical protein